MLATMPQKQGTLNKKLKNIKEKEKYKRKLYGATVQ